MPSSAPTSFSFATAGRVVFGVGESERVPALAAARGSRVFVVLGPHTDPAACALAGLPQDAVLWRWTGEPTVGASKPRSRPPGQPAPTSWWAGAAAR